MVLRQGSICGDVVRYASGVNCTIWHPFEGMEDAGICWDFPLEEIDDLIALLREMKEVEPEEYEEGTD